MSQVFKEHWQYITVVIGLVLTMITSAYNYGIFYQRCNQLVTDVTRYNVENTRLAQEVKGMNITLEKLITAIEIKNGVIIK